MVDDIGDAMVAIGWLRERRKLLMLNAHGNYGGNLPKSKLSNSFAENFILLD